MPIQRPLVALIAGLLCIFVLAGAMVIAYVDLASAPATITLSVSAALLVAVLAGSVGVIANAMRRLPGDP